MSEGHPKDLRSELSEIAGRVFRLKLAVKNGAYTRAYLELGKLADYIRDVQYVVTGEMETDDGEPPF